MSRPGAARRVHLSHTSPNFFDGDGGDASDGGAGPEPGPRPTIRDFETRIHRYNSDLERDSLTFKAALILMASTEFGHNVDVLARRTGLDRSLVARVARRLIDNGVWNAGVTVADWRCTDEASGTFWNDVAVAEGKMCRRIGPSGSIEWAPAGFWNKNFQFIEPDEEKSLAARYLDATPADGGDEAAEPPGEDVPADPAPDLDAAPEDRDSGPSDLATELETEVVGPLPGPPAVASHPRKPATVPDLDDLFGNVVWIG